jgi:hypothetical protein
MNIPRVYTGLLLGTLLSSMNVVWAETSLNANARFMAPRVSSLHNVLLEASIDHNIQASWDGTITKSIVIDDQTRYIGGNLLQENQNDQTHKVWPTMKFPFTLSKQWGKIQPVLNIKQLQGIVVNDSASPVIIQLNGYKIAYLIQNGENIQIRIPAGIINRNGQNILQIRAGYHLKDLNTIVYDRVELNGLIMTF